MANNNDSDSSSMSSSDESESADIVLETKAPPSYFGNIEVTNSSGIHFGNTAVYNGPVTVQQFLNSSNVEEQSTNNGARNFDPSSINNILPITFDDNVQTTTDNNVKKPPPFAQQFSVIVSNSSDNVQGWCERRYWLVVSGVATLLVSLIVVLILVLTLSGSSATNNEDWSDYYNKNQTVLNGTEGIAPLYHRADWLAQPVSAGDKFKKPPVPYVIISHSAAAPCFNNSQCVFQVRKIQTFHIESTGWRDIGYNFLVGGDGGAYEGRGWDLVGAHAFGYNNRSIGICFIGTFISEIPPERQMRAAKLLIEEGVKLGKISADYKLLGHRQVSATESPGSAFYSVLQTWPQWAPIP